MSLGPRKRANGERGFGRSPNSRSRLARNDSVPVLRERRESSSRRIWRTLTAESSETVRDRETDDLWSFVSYEKLSNERKRSSIGQSVEELGRAGSGFESPQLAK